MAEENRGQEPEQGLLQEEELLPPLEETPPPEEPVEKKREGLLMPILYALLAGVGAFTLALIIGIVVTFLTQPAEPSESPSIDPSSQVTSSLSPDGTETQEPQESDGEDGDAGDTGNADDADAPE